MEEDRRNSEKEFKRDPKKYRSGFEDKLEPLESFDLSKAVDFDEMLKGMEKTAYGGRKLGEAAETLYQMVSDKDAFVVMTLSGAMTAGKMGLIICEMIDRGFVQAVVSTGALMTHGFVESSGKTHFKYNPGMKDSDLYKAGYNRIYDTIELEKNLDDVEKIAEEVFDEINPETVLDSRLINRGLGKWLSENIDGPGILKSAYKMNVPVYIPAFTDSELGLDMALSNRRRIAEDKRPLKFDSFSDLNHYAELVNQQEKLGLFTIGGGVPRNWAQQVGPYLELIKLRLAKVKSSEHIRCRKFTYALRICPESEHWGGLSGCTYSEGVSWGKFLPKEMGGRQTEVLSDATLVWPLLVKGVIQRLEKNKVKIQKNFNFKEQLEKVDKILEIG